MNHKKYYLTAKQKLLNDPLICKENKQLFKKFLEYQEKKGKRSNGLAVLDDGCYKTLNGYIQKFKNVNLWFKNKPLKDITKKDIERVYEDLEENRILKKNGKPLEDKSSYYQKIFKSVLFEMINKDKMAKEVIRYNTKKDKDVRFIPDFKDSLKKLVASAIQPEHKLLIQLLGDFGENVGAVLELEKKDFIRQTEEETKEPEYLLVFKKEILKRSRTPRTEPNIFSETVEMLDEHLKNLKPNDRLFNFGIRQAEKILSRAFDKTKIKIQNGEKPKLKDLRSSLACYLLDEHWTTDEIKSRLGHKPSSNVLDVYVTYKALNKKKPKKKIYEGNIRELKEKLETMEIKNKKKDLEITEQNNEIKRLKEKVNMIIKEDRDYSKQIKAMIKLLKEKEIE